YERINIKASEGKVPSDDEIRTHDQSGLRVVISNQFDIPFSSCDDEDYDQEEESGNKNRKKRKRIWRGRSWDDNNGSSGTSSKDSDCNTEDSSEGVRNKKSNSKRTRKQKRKHRSVPETPEQRVPTVITCSDSDGTIHQGTNARSSVSNAEDFKLNDEFNNMYASARLFEQPPGGLRPIAIDGCNVAWGHGNDQEFSYKGIVLCADYFRARGHSVKAFVPRQHQHLIPRDIVDELVRDEVLVFTPSRQPGNQGKRITAYDDRFIVQYAVCTGGVVISNDNFNDLYSEQLSWRDTITNRVLQHTWISKDILMFQLDPMGRKGHLTLDEFLKFPSNNATLDTSTSSKSMDMVPRLDSTPLNDNCHMDVDT
ncbi:unnamed protein product, partial [Allacma fusca]